MSVVTSLPAAVQDVVWQAWGEGESLRRIPLRALRVSGTTRPKIVLLRAPPGPRLCARVCLGE